MTMILAIKVDTLNVEHPVGAKRNEYVSGASLDGNVKILKGSGCSIIGLSVYAPPLQKVVFLIYVRKLRKSVEDGVLNLFNLQLITKENESNLSVLRALRRDIVIIALHLSGTLPLCMMCIPRMLKLVTNFIQ